MYKVIDLGCQVPETGEPRVRVLDDSLVKTASSEMQEYWDGLEPSEDFSYLWVIGVSAAEYYGCNKNGDAFTEKDLMATHHRFVDTANIFVQHVNRDPAKSIGKPVYSWYNPDMHRVELVLAVDKRKPGAAEIVTKISSGEQLYVSMGCNVAYDVCSIWGNKAPSRAAYCDHLRYNMKKILDDGRQVFAWNPNPEFFDISVVRRPADPTAFALDKIASEGAGSGDAVVSSAELGEQAEDIQQKLAAIDKLSDILKSVDGIVIDKKDEGSDLDSDFTYGDEEKSWYEDNLYHKGFLDALRLVCMDETHKLEPSEFDHDYLDSCDVSPAGLMCLLHSSGVRPSLSDAVYMAARHVMGPGVIGTKSIPGLLSMLPMALSMLRRKPDIIGGLANDIFSDYNGELDSAGGRHLLSEAVKPVARVRITLIKAFPKTAFEQAGNWGAQPYPKYSVGVNIADDISGAASNIKRSFEPLHFTDKLGRTIITTPYDLRSALPAHYAGKLLKGKNAVALMLALGAAALAASDKSTLARAAATAALAVPAMKLTFGTSNEQTITSREGVEVPAELVTQALHKNASMSAPSAFTVGALVPALLAADYMFNKSRTGGAYPYDPDKGSIDRALYYVGEKAADSPFRATIGSGLIAAALAARLGGRAARRSTLPAVTIKVK